MTTDLVYRLKKRAEIRRQIPNRKSVQNGETDRLADLLEEAAEEIQRLNEEINNAQRPAEPVTRVSHSDSPLTWDKLIDHMQAKLGKKHD